MSTASSKTTLFLIATALCCAVATAEDASEMRPFQAGVEWEFKTGLFNVAVAKDGSDRTMADIFSFEPTRGCGHDGGMKTWKVAKAAGDELQLTERYDYPEAAPGTPEVKAQLPAEAVTYKITTETTDGVEMNALSTDRGAGEEYVFLLPVKPIKDQKWFWKTTTGSFKTGQPSKDDLPNTNAYGEVLSIESPTLGSMRGTEAKAVEIKLTIEGISSHWWWSADKGLVRFGGENLGRSREALTLTRPSTEVEGQTVTFDMDALVYLRVF